MAKYIIKDLSAKEIEQVLVTTYHALRKPLLIYPTLESLKKHVKLELRTGTQVHKLKQISSADDKVIIPYDECHIGDSLFVLNGIQLDEYKLARKNPSVDLPIIGTDETNGFLYLICSTSLSISAGIALDSNTFAFPEALKETADTNRYPETAGFFKFLGKLSQLIEDGIMLRNTTYYGAVAWEEDYMPVIYPYIYEDAEKTRVTHLGNAEMAVHILYDYGVNLEITSFSAPNKSARSWMMTLPFDKLTSTPQPSELEVYHWTGTAEVGRLVCS